MRYTAVAADVKREKEVWINSGRLFDAIRASISLPLFFTPVEYRSGHLIDGGVLNPVPIAPTFNDDTDLTVAVNLGGPLQAETISKNAESRSADCDPSFQEKVSQFISDLQGAKKPRSGDDWSVYDIADQAFDAMQSTIARQKLAAYPPDINIEIARNACETLEFDRADEMIELGRQKASELLQR